MFVVSGGANGSKFLCSSTATFFPQQDDEHMTRLSLPSIGLSQIQPIPPTTGATTNQLKGIVGWALTSSPWRRRQIHRDQQLMTSGEEKNLAGPTKRTRFPQNVSLREERRAVFNIVFNLRIFNQYMGVHIIHLSSHSVDPPEPPGGWLQ